MTETKAWLRPCAPRPLKPCTLSTSSQDLLWKHQRHADEVTPQGILVLEQRYSWKNTVHAIRGNFKINLVSTCTSQMPCVDGKRALCTPPFSLEHCSLAAGPPLPARLSRLFPKVLQPLPHPLLGSFPPTPLEPNLYLESFPGGASGKEPACQCRRHKRRGFDPCIEITWNRAWLPTPVFLPWESHGQKSLAGYSPWGCKESDKTEVTQQACPHSIWKPKSVPPEGRRQNWPRGWRRQIAKLRITLSSNKRKRQGAQAPMLVTGCSRKSSAQGCWSRKMLGVGGAYCKAVEAGARKCWPWPPGSRELAWVTSWGSSLVGTLHPLAFHAQKGYLAAAHLGLCKSCTAAFKHSWL